MPPTQPVTIRRAAKSDAQTIAGYQVNLARETEDIRLDPAIVIRGVTAVFEDKGKGEYWVAEGGGKIVGCLLTTYEWSDWRNAIVLWIQSLYVEKDWRGKGVFRALYDTLKKRVDEEPGILGVRLAADQSNAEACKVYDQIGMRRDHYYLYEKLKPGMKG